MIAINYEWTKDYPEASAGMLILSDIRNTDGGKQMNKVKRELEKNIKHKYSDKTRNELKTTYPINVYVTYYKKFGYSYHVLLQLESLIKGKPIPDVSAPVEAMFMAELKNGLLTAVHDFDKINPPLSCKISQGSEEFVTLNGKTVSTVEDDMMICDADGIISSILRGPDRRTAVGASTSRVLYTTYAPPGVDKSLVMQHLDDIESYVKVFSGEAKTEMKKCIHD